MYILPFNSLSDHEFYCLFNVHSLAHDIVFEKVFNLIDAKSGPLDTDEETRLFTNIFQNVDSRYKNIDGVNSCEAKYANVSGLKIIHFNIRSLRKNFITLKEHLSLFTFDFDVIAISESWMKENDFNYFGLPKYNVEHIFRHTKIGGGVTMYIHKDIKYQVIHALSFIEGLNSVNIYKYTKS